MSDWVMNIVPTDPDYVASEAQAEAALKRLIELVEHVESSEIKMYPSPRFVDIGEWMDSVQCPQCLQVLNPLDPYDDSLFNWLSDLPSQLDDRKSRITIPTCGHTSAAEALIFRCPTAYARTVLTVMNPLDMYPPTDERLLQEVGSVLGCDVREVWGHY